MLICFSVIMVLWLSPRMSLVVYACPVLRVRVMMSETYFQMVQQRNHIWNEKNMLSSDEVKQAAWNSMDSIPRNSPGLGPHL